MAISAYAGVSLTKAKSYMPASGTAKDTFLEDEILRWTREIERHLGRRLVFRAPTETSENAIVNGVSWTTGVIAVANQPTSPGRTLVVTWTAATAGTLTVTGTVGGVAGITEVFDSANGLTQYGVKFFSAISAAAAAGATGGGTVTVRPSKGYVEYHTPQPFARMPHVLRAREFPILYVGDLNEDPDRTFGSTTTLVEGTGFETVDRELLVRTSGKLPIKWALGYRSVKVCYSAGYFTTVNVPAEIQSVLCELVAWSYRHSQWGQQGLTSGSDSTGTFVLSGPPMITSEMAARLRDFKVQDVCPTGSRDFDLEAA